MNEGSYLSGAQGKRISERYRWSTSALKKLKDKHEREINKDSNSEEAKDEEINLKRKHEKVWNELDEIKAEYLLLIENKNENERILINEIKALKSKISPEAMMENAYYFETKTNSDNGTVEHGAIRRDSNPKPLSEYYESLSVDAKIRPRILSKQNKL